MRLPVLAWAPKPDFNLSLKALPLPLESWPQRSNGLSVRVLLGLRGLSTQSLIQGFGWT